MPAWNIIYLGENDTELEIGYIDENNRISGVKAKSIKRFLVRHGWPKVTLAYAYAMRSDVRAVEVDPRMAKSKGVLFSRPKDESLEAFKAWIGEMFTHITGRTEDSSLSEERWVLYWKEFWSKASEMSENGNQGPEDQD